MCYHTFSNFGYFNTRTKVIYLYAGPLGEKGENKCYFFTPTLKNNWNWGRRNRVANNGHWKPTARDRPIYDNGNKKAGIKKTLVFINLRGKKTKWIMHEYMIEDHREKNRNNSTKVREIKMMLL